MLGEFVAVKQLILRLIWNISLLPNYSDASLNLGYIEIRLEIAQVGIRTLREVSPDLAE